jgi:hypothetical protein
VKRTIRNKGAPIIPGVRGGCTKETFVKLKKSYEVMKAEGKCSYETIEELSFAFKLMVSMHEPPPDEIAPDANIDLYLDIPIGEDDKHARRSRLASTGAPHPTLFEVGAGIRAARVAEGQERRKGKSRRQAR